MKTNYQIKRTLATGCILASWLTLASPTFALDSYELDPFTVNGEPIERYRAVDALTGNKVGANLSDLPLSLSVVPQQLIEDRAIDYLGEALDNVSGAQRKLGYGGTQNFGAYIRGFDSSFLTLRNGLRDFGFYTLRDSANVERFEVLKGPASVLYGSLNPGGITNTVTKKPIAETTGKVYLSAGSDDRYRSELDAGGPLGENLYYRLNLAYEDEGSHRFGVESEGVFVAPVVTWKISDRTAWTIETEFKQATFTWDLGIPRDPVAFEVPIETFLGEPDSENDVHSLNIVSTLEHRLNDSWTVRQKIGYAESDGDYELRSAWRIQEDGRTADRSGFDTVEGSSNVSVQHEFVGLFNTGEVSHQLVAGLDFYRDEQVYDFIFRGLEPMDVFNPVYGMPIGDGFPLFGSETTTDAVGVYFQDLIKFNRQVTLLLGARYDAVDIEDYDRLAETSGRDTSDGALNPQVGAVYQPTDDTSLYASYSSSFLPVLNGRTADGDYLDPEKGRQIEIGIKRELFEGRIFATLAAYRIVKEDVATPDPDDPTFRVQTAEQTSKGVELDITGEILPNWDIAFAASYIDAYVSEDNLFAVGSALPGAAEWSSSLWSKYSFSDGFAKGFSFGFGVYNVSKRQAGLPNYDWFVPSYTRFDGMLSYAWDSWKLQINAKNLSDERIYDLSSTSIMPQQPRSWQLSAAYRF